MHSADSIGVWCHHPRLTLLLNYVMLSSLHLLYMVSTVVGKRVPGTWSGVLDVFVFCVDDVDLLDTRTRVGPLAGTPSTATRYRGTDRRRQVRPGGASGGRGPEAARPLENSKRRSGEHAAVIPRVSQSPTDDNERDLREIILENDEPVPHLGCPSPPCSTARRRLAPRKPSTASAEEEPVQAQQRETSRNL